MASRKAGKHNLISDLNLVTLICMAEVLFIGLAFSIVKIDPVVVCIFWVTVFKGTFDVRGRFGFVYKTIIFLLGST